jgi:peroxiredoxin
MQIRVGQKAPDFALDSHLDREYRLSEFQGYRNVVLAFFPWAWTPV